MATKEDILEQLVEEYLLHKGYFVQHNLKYLPRKDHPNFISNKDSNHSDIDVIGYHPLLEGNQKVLVISCKSWQAGFNPTKWISAIELDKTINGRKAWQAFRELACPKWSEAFIKTIQDTTGSKDFTYITAVTFVKGDKTKWENHLSFREALGGAPIKILTLSEMVAEIRPSLSQTVARTEIGRILQLFSAAGFETVEKSIRRPNKP